MDNPFVLDKREYKRNIDVLRQYVIDTSTYLSIVTGKSFDECVEFIQTQLKPGGKFEYKDPEVLYLERGDNEDRHKKTTTLSKYLTNSILEKELIAPTLTTYINPKKKQSLLVNFIDGNVKARSIAKKAMFAAKVAGDKVTETFKKSEQTNKKLNNNSISGAHCSAGTPFYNKSAHSTLTSNCRVTSGYGNANNEKLLNGNRHYWSPDIVRNNIISIINNTDLALLEKAMYQFNIRCPTIKETIECYRYSTDLYWKGDVDHESLSTLISKLTNIQRAAFVYIGDLYHLMKYNENVIHTFISKLSLKCVKEHSDPDSEIKNASDDIRSLASQICYNELKGIKISDVKGTADYNTYASTIENINNTLIEYIDLIRAFWLTPNMPASVGAFPDSIRRCAITSDTDSTIFTVQDWVLWHQGTLVFNDKTNAVAASVIFLAAQTVTHLLARMSANFGIEEKRLHQIAMKNEYFFPAFCPTDINKHYYALISCQEGSVFKTFEKEIKGVHLKSSNAPKEIIKDAEKMMLYILNTVVEGNKISIKHILKWIADKEREIEASIKRGDSEYFRLTQIKEPKSYKNAEDTSAYKQYLLWQEVFSSKYGLAPNPPYTAIKIGTDIKTPIKTKAWLASIVDRSISDKLGNWLNNNNRNSFGGMLLLPEQIVSSSGIPEEISIAIGIRDIIADTTSIYYLILETLGIYTLNKKKTNLAMDYY